jgi:hypothetical protein
MWRDENRDYKSLEVSTNERRDAIRFRSLPKPH